MGHPLPPHPIVAGKSPDCWTFQKFWRKGGGVIGATRRKEQKIIMMHYESGVCQLRMVALSEGKLVNKLLEIGERRYMTE